MHALLITILVLLKGRSHQIYSTFVDMKDKNTINGAAGF
jgi:hypothetical protein